MPRPLLARWEAALETATALAEDERAAGLPPTRLPDPGFAQIAQSWASGRPLSRVLDLEEVTGGDFVRTVKALIDLLRQIGQVAVDPDTAAAARAAADGLFRGVVAAASSVGTMGDSEELPEEVAEAHAVAVSAVDVAAPLDAELQVLEALADAPDGDGDGGGGAGAA